MWYENLVKIDPKSLTIYLKSAISEETLLSFGPQIHYPKRGIWQNFMSQIHYFPELP
jgi:hypothetical protein